MGSNKVHVVLDRSSFGSSGPVTIKPSLKHFQQGTLGEAWGGASTKWCFQQQKSTRARCGPQRPGLALGEVRPEEENSFWAYVSALTSRRRQHCCLIFFNVDAPATVTSQRVYSTWRSQQLSDPLYSKSNGSHFSRIKK
ncbi:unnamed protein product [Prunus armeniaca]